MEHSMKTGLGGLAVAVALAVWPLGPAAATDLGPAYEAPQPTPLSWTGFYAGVAVGASWLDADWRTTKAFNPEGGNWPFSSPPNASFSDEGVRVGGYLGYNWQIKPAWVVGVEADLAWDDANKDTVKRIPGIGVVNAVSQGALAQSFVEVDRGEWDASLRGRVGYLVTPTILAYATGGLALIEIEAKATCPRDTFVCNPAFPAISQSHSDTLVGWTVGGGVEVMFGPRWLGRVEYRFSEFEDMSFTALKFRDNRSFGAKADLSPETQILTAGVAYRF